MGIIRRFNNYYIDYYYQGRRIRECVSKNKRDAEAALAVRKSEIVQGRYQIRKRGDVRLDVFSKTYMEYSRANKRSWKRDEVSLKNLLPFFGDRMLSDISPFLIEKYKIKRSAKAKPATVNRELALLKHMYTMAIKWRKTFSNPVKEVKLFREENTQERILTQEEIRILLEACSDSLRPIVVTAVNSGMRLGEILTLTWGQVDFEQRVITILHSKSGKVRKVPMNETLWETLRAIKKNAAQDAVFISDRTGRPYKINCRGSWDKALKKAGISDCRFHDLRHTFASHLVAAGVDIITVQQLLGHSTIVITQRYAHSAPQSKREAVALLKQRLDARSGHFLDTSEYYQKQRNSVSL